jgi:hypothetical protein
VTGGSGDTKGTFCLGADPVDCDDVPTGMKAIVAGAPVTWAVLQGCFLATARATIYRGDVVGITKKAASSGAGDGA